MLFHNLAVQLLLAAAFHHVEGFVPQWNRVAQVTRLQVSMHNRRTTVDFYAMLEVSPHASADEIKRAYRKMAKKYHPGESERHNVQSLIVLFCLVLLCFAIA